ncbi:MAG TPA: hypothetical protein VE007_09935, partial [Thermoanaerobaculia bacterium]|nr:hypothetical protein [Thermoanaerobaculia bacterium]
MLDFGAKCRECRRLEKAVQRQLELEILSNTGDEARRLNRIATRPEEMGILLGRIYLQNVRPHFREPA